MSLKHKKNFDLRLRVLVDNISPSQLCFMTEEVGLSNRRSWLQTL